MRLELMRLPDFTPGEEPATSPLLATSTNPNVSSSLSADGRHPNLWDLVLLSQRRCGVLIGLHFRTPRPLGFTTIWQSCDSHPTGFVLWAAHPCFLILHRGKLATVC